MRYLFLILTVVAMAFGAGAQDEVTRFAYVKKGGVNLRTDPSTSSKVLMKSEAGDMYIVMEQNGDWTHVEVPEGMDSVYAWISSQFIKVLNHKGFPEEKLNSQFIYDEGADFGVLTFEDAGTDEYDNKMVNYSYLVKNRELQEMGGNGVVLNEGGAVRYFDGYLMQPEQWIEYSTVYDEEQGLLWFGGLLWEEEK